MSKKKLTYKEAIDELNAIIEQIKDSDMNVDTVNNNIKRAVELVKFCKSELYTTEQNINKILEEADLN
ncbi:MAG: exodeoxyribonuclease VII small subunit [Prevotellaceae bacterium]|jgi:exodeoxyribonuclease VII small subunit|nr:exodeoxyribonuclease VII small subunit [Prevotellaceae bacterium]